jgi:DNA mismatch repair protein MutS2
MPEVAAKKREEAISLEEQTLALDRERAALQEAREELDSLNRRQSLEVERLKETRRKVLSEESDALRSEVKEARIEVRRLRQAMKNQDAAELRKLEGSLDRAASVVSMGGEVDRQVRASGPSQAALPPEKLKVGARVGIRGFQSTGEILEAPKKGKIRVLVGVMKMSVALADLLPATEPATKSSKTGPKKKGQRASQGSLSDFQGERAAPVRSEDVTLDLRGKRVEEGLLEADHFIDELLRNQEPGGFVLHGHGTGAMKEAVRQHLRAHSCVASSRPAERDEGGDAFTVLWLGS